MKGRAMQLDGLRAIAMMAICWDHWRPAGWSRIFPFEVFLFLFLVLTGYLITGSLLRERERHGDDTKPWRLEALKNYHLRRGLRIMAPYYIALFLGLLVGAPDLYEAFGWYFFHLSNLHMASMDYWPQGTNHFWSLALQQQFYLIWPFVIWFTPRKWLVVVMVLVTTVSPLARMCQDFFSQWWASPQLLTWMSLDYFGVGGLLAVAVNGGISLRSRRLMCLSGLSWVAYALIFTAHQQGLPTWGLRGLQQSFLALGLCGVIAIGISGVSGHFKWVLENRAIQRVGQLSFGVYLFHNLAPLLTGKLFWFLWDKPFTNPWGDFIRISLFAAVTWGLAEACWRWVETPLQTVRSSIKPQRADH
jgi:peptidoglycan/LPS O-acetylase OafA/YrhL